MNGNRPIGIFDSGVGGLSILQEVHKLLPKESIIYVADQANNPYGSRSEKEIRKFSSDIVSFLVKHKVKLVIIACNTATVYALDHLRSKFDIPIIGIVPVIKTAAAHTKNGHIGVLSTVATANSDYQNDLINKFAKAIKVSNIGTDVLVPYVEKGDIDSKDLEVTLRKVLKQFTDIDVLALGCSHFPFLKSRMQKILGPAINIYDSGAAVARQTAEVLKSNRAFGSNTDPELEYYTTGDPREFTRVAGLLTNLELDHVIRAAI